MSVGIIGGNVASIRVLQASVNLGSVAANTTEEENATLAGVKVGDIVIGSKPSLEAGLIIANPIRVIADGNLRITVGNFSGIAIDETTETWTFTVIRPETNYRTATLSV